MSSIIVLPRQPDQALDHLGLGSRRRVSVLSVLGH
jgi:hypothetical protein